MTWLPFWQVLTSISPCYIRVKRWTIAPQAARLAHRYASLDMEMTDFSKPEELDSRIMDLVEQHWQDNQTPLLLSRLGSHGGGEIARQVKAQGKGLGNYLRHRLTDRVRVIQHSGNPTITGVVPASDAPDTDEENDALLEKTRQGSSVATAPRFHPAFWAAFRKPLDESNRRYMSVEAPIRFHESSEGSQPDGFLEVPKIYIATSDTDEDQTLQNAEKWIDDNSLRKETYLVPAKSALHSGHPQNLLDRVLFSLEPKDLSRISMPLDVILRLRKQPQ